MLEAQTLNKVTLESNGFCSDEKPTTQEVVAPVINYLADQIRATMANLIHLDDPVELASDIIHALNSMESLQMQLQLAVDVLNTESDEDIPELKKKAKFVDEAKYIDFVSKEQINTASLESVVPYLFKKIFPDVKRILDQCFKLNSYKEIQLIDNSENFAFIKIITFKLEILSNHFASMLFLPKEDIFSNDRSSLVWQELYKSATIKQFITKQDIRDSFKAMNVACKVMRAILKNHYEGKASEALKRDFKAYFTLFKDILYYGANEVKAEMESMLYLTKPSIETAFKITDLCDHPTVLALTNLRCPIIGDECMIYIPRLFPQITKKLIFTEYDTNSINKLTPFEASQFEVPELKEPLAQIRQDLLIQGENKVPVRILSPVSLKFREEMQKPSGLSFKGLAKNISSVFETNLSEEGIVIHIHGGGFVSMSSASHRPYLTRWVKKSGMIHFSIDYRLAPKDPYPAAIDDIWQSYLWITNYAQTILGIKTDKVVLVGDSAGGNLILALSLRIAKAGLKPPKGCLAIYPSLYMSDSHYTPSLLHSIDDAVLPYGLLKLVLKAYVPEDFKPLEDPFLSPLVASDELLERLPPIRFVTGSDDPLHDDNWRLLHRLKKLNKDAKIVLHQDMWHGYYCNIDLKNYEQYNNEACELVKELLNI